MKKISLGMEYKWEGKGSCTLRHFHKCRDTDVVVPRWVPFKGKVTKIGNFAFSENSALQSIVIPEGVVSIGAHAFKDCKNLERVVLPQSLMSIDSSAFVDCENLEEIVFPPNLSVIDSYAFFNCSALKSIDLTHVRKVGNGAFFGCDSLTEIVPGNEIKRIYGDPFRNSGYYKDPDNWEDGLLYLGNWVVGCNGQQDEYTVKASTVGFAEKVFFDGQHVKRTKNPEYDEVLKHFYMALEFPNMPLPDLLGTPKYFEEIFPVKMRYQGTFEEWNRIFKMPGEKKIPATVTTEDGTFETCFPSYYPDENS